MLVAVPLFGRLVAPRFCSATEVLLSEVESQGGRRIGRLLLEEHDGISRLRALRGRGVDVLLCNGFNRRFLPGALALGVHVYWGLWGDAEELVERLSQGELGGHLAETSPRPGRCCGRGPGGRGRGARFKLGDP